jgi:hypothetical protein
VARRRRRAQEEGSVGGTQLGRAPHRTATTAMTDVEDIIAALKEAITRGVPLFNKGDHGASRSQAGGKQAPPSASPPQPPHVIARACGAGMRRGRTLEPVRRRC